jgi:hypothetical protein
MTSKAQMLTIQNLPQVWKLAGVLLLVCASRSYWQAVDPRAVFGHFTTFDAPGSGTGQFQGTHSQAINPAGAITGYYIASFVNHGFLRIIHGTK